MKSDLLKILFFLGLSLSIYSCGRRDDSDVSKAFDSLKQTLAVDSIKGNDSLSFEKTINVFSGKYNAVTDWSRYGGEGGAFRKNILHRYLLVPVLKEQVQEIKDNGFSDTTLVFTGDKNSAFVFLIDKGESVADKLPAGTNGLLLVKAKEVREAKKLYLVKKHTDFQHRELKVTEYTITAELVDAVSTDVSAKALEKIFGAQW